MAQYLLIGGNGIIGHFVARRLVAQGARPVIFSRGGDTTLVRDIADQCDHVRGDMTNRAAIDAALQKYRITHVVHLGAALPALTEKDPAAAVRLNIEGTAHVLQAAVDNGVARVVLASSKAVYGRMQGAYAAPTYAPVPETLHPEPDTVYGISKGACEQLADWYRRQHGLDCVALRFAATIGPGKIARHGGSFSRHSVIVENAMAGHPVRVDGDVDAVCDGLFNDEGARGIVCALQAPKVRHLIYNIATGSGFSLRQFAAAVQRRFPDAVFTFEVLPGAGGASNFVLDPARAREDFGFVADADLDRIVQAYVATMDVLGLAPDVERGGGREVARQGLMSARVDGGKGSVHVDT